MGPPEGVPALQFTTGVVSFLRTVCACTPQQH
jgi:hypothetical protein